MKYIAFDTETYPFPIRGKATLKTCPRLVCLSYHTGPSTHDPVLLGRDDGIAQFMSWMKDPDVTLIGANTQFDLLVMARACHEEAGENLLPAIFDMCEDGRIIDIQIREQLADIAQGGMFIRGAYSLGDLVKRYLNRKVEGKSGPDVWRVRYHELDGIPVDSWPEAASEYAKLDAWYTHQVFNRQRSEILNEAYQVCASLCLGLMSAWGLMTDTEHALKVDAFYAQREDLHRREMQAIEVDTSAYSAYLAQQARINGDSTPAPLSNPLRLIRKSGSQDMKAKKALVYNAFQSLGENPILTDKGAVKTDKKVFAYLTDKGASDPAFQIIRRFNQATKFRSTYLTPILDSQGGPLCARFRPLVNTGRISCASPNMTNIPARLNAEERERRAADPIAIVGADIRGAFIPRPGHVFIGADYAAIEMGGLAQVLCNLNGHITTLGESINRGEDQHLRVAVHLLGEPYDVLARKHKENKAAAKAGDPKPYSGVHMMREIAKIANYGFAGGASAQTFIDYASQFGIKIDIETATLARRAWLSSWPEMQDYFSWISSQEQIVFVGGERRSRYDMMQHGPGGAMPWRPRLCFKYTEAANTMFQGICADGAKLALWYLTKACWVDESSPLFGCRPVLFVHDEFVLEVPEDRAGDAGAELERLMIEGMKAFLPDIEVKAEYEIMHDRWSK